MASRRPGAVDYAALFQVLLGLIWLLRAFEVPGVLPRLLIVGLAVSSHFASAIGLYFRYEWGRTRAIQISVFDILGTFHLLLVAHLTPFGALLQLGMPLYTLSVLADPKVRDSFS